MPRYEAQVWVSGEHPYQCEINAANVFDARRNIARREGVKEHEVNRVFVLRDDNETSSSSSSSGGVESFGNSAAICAGLLLLWLIVEFWMWILPITLIGAILYYFGTKED
tara:strand:- start:426 stop:755 length:330 start_codon:yes stop_codon:yes gene_type:complete